MDMRTWKRLGIGLIFPAAVLVIWYLYTTYADVPNSILPKIQTVAATCRDMVASGQLQEDLWISIRRVLEGFLASGVLGIVLGSLMGMSKTVEAFLMPTLTTVRQIPMIAWIPLIILWAGIGESSKVIIIMIAATFPILMNTLSGISSTPIGLVEVARLHKLSKWQTFLKVYLPHALPQMLVGLKLGLGVSWMAVVASELIAASSGIGYRMNDARSLMRSDQVIVCMIVVGIIGVLMDKIMSIIFDAATPWEQIAKKEHRKK